MIGRTGGVVRATMPSLGVRRGLMVAVASVLVLAAACDGAEQPDASTGAADSSGEPDATDVVGSTVDLGGEERFRTEGITFLYPSAVFSSAAEQPAPEHEGVTVDLAAPSGDGDGTASVVMLRSQDGEYVDGLSDEDRAAAERLEGSLNEIDDNALDFVNGMGIRSADGGAYRFEGITDDGRFLVRVSSRSASAQAAIDGLVASIFVDGSAARFEGEGCEEAVELLVENGLPPEAILEAGAEVEAEWEVRNTGTCAWGSGHGWVFTGGDPLVIVATSGFDRVAPNETSKVTVTFLAPEEPGAYAAQWQLQPPGRLDAVPPAAFVLFEVVA